MMGRRVVPAAAAVALGALALASTAAADKEKVHFTAADQARAKTIVLRLADLGGAKGGWSGGTVQKRSTNSALKCKGFNPKQSDLVLTGKAESDFTSQLVHLDNEVQFLRTRQMVKLDWRRTVEAAALVPCLKHEMATTLPRGETFVSFKRVAFPRLGDETAAFRGVFDVRAGKVKLRFMVDLALVGVGRSEITLVTTAPYADAAAVAAGEHRLAQILAQRAVPPGSA